MTSQLLLCEGAGVVSASRVVVVTRPGRVVIQALTGEASLADSVAS